MKRLPFISRRAHEAAVQLAVAGIWHMVDDADERTNAETGARLDAEHALADVRKELAQEQAKRDRLKAYMVQTHATRYEQRLARLVRACARYRAEAAIQRRVIRRLTDQLLDATGHKGKPLLPAARADLGITTKEDA